ncbi:MAG TPA: bifunctional phosphopantothenoylcysteine decarboxylase/phosphopantothenate--cysteine ligase CoaBC [Polyangiaceae bacterium]|nr:bifunctional phosphopantothenoylcysteine decarboxylase/phosphopantothenate--cysteine ligase CoaBC [Polyangiaceae bacterium]
MSRDASTPANQGPVSPRDTAPDMQVEARAGLAGRHVTLCVTGSVAAYKAVLVVRKLMAEGASVSVVLSRSAEHFVGAATFAGLTGEPTLTDMFAAGTPGEPHVELGASSDLVLVVPATADVLARFASGRADDLTSALVLCARCPVLVAPAMHPRMWAHPATRRNVETLGRDGRITFVGPEEGEVASGEVGTGRMAEPDAIVSAAFGLLGDASLEDLRVVVTAGPTVEALDPVRYVGNRSSGKMGFAIAERAARRGAQVTLIAGPVSLPTPSGVTRVDVQSAESMRTALWQALGAELTGADALIMAAAVADFRPAAPSTSKIRRTEQGLTLALVPNPDLLAELGKARRGARPLLVGFALGTEEDAAAVATAREKLRQKRVDLVVANHADESLGKDDIRALFVAEGSVEAVPLGPKGVVADRLLDRVAAELASRHG